MNSIRKIKQGLTIEWLRGDDGRDTKECFWIGQLMCGGRTYWDGNAREPIWGGR